MRTEKWIGRRSCDCVPAGDAYGAGTVDSVSSGGVVEAAVPVPGAAVAAAESGPRRYDDRLTRFARRLAAAGARLVLMDAGQTLEEAIRSACPEARHIRSFLAEPIFRAESADAEDVRQTTGATDLCVVTGAFGVAENGGVWIPQRKECQSFRPATSLLVVLPADAVVDTLQEAVRRPEVDEFGFGCLVTGPTEDSGTDSASLFGAVRSASLTVVMRSSGNGPVVRSDAANR